MNHLIEFFKKNWRVICVSVGVLIAFVGLAVVLAVCMPESDGVANQGASGSAGLLFEEVSGGYAVYKGNCTVKTIVIPSTYNGSPVVAIGDSGFKESDATSITIPDSVQTIGEEAFYNAELREITLGNGVKTIKDKAFYFASSLRNIMLPASVESIGVQVFVCYNLANIEVDENNQYFKSIEGVLYSKDEKTLVAYPKGKDKEKITIPEGVTTIAASAFWNNTDIEFLEISDSVKTIGDEAFYKCANLEYINMGNGVETIGKMAFAYCPEIKNITFSKNLKIIQDNAFAHSDSTSLKKLVIPDGVTKIGDGAFQHCFFLEHVTIPTSVSHIGRGAFSTTLIVAIKYEGTMAQWNSVIKEDFWIGYAEVVRVNCTDGTVSHRGKNPS